MLCSRLLRSSRHATDALLLVDGLPEGLGHLAALQPLDHLEKVMTSSGLADTHTLSHCDVRACVCDLGELLEAEFLAGLCHLLDDLSDLVAGQPQVGGPEELGELLFADVAVVVDI